MFVKQIQDKEKPEIVNLEVDKRYINSEIMTEQPNRYVMQV